MKRVSPVMLLGLGEAGAKSVESIHRRLLNGAPELAPLVQSVWLSTDGLLRDSADGTPLELKGLKKDISDGVFEANYNTLLAQSEAIIPWLAERFGRLLRQDARMGLQQLNYVLSTDITLLLITELSDPLGSACLIPLLMIVQELLGGRMRGAVIEPSIIGFFPDVFPESRDMAAAYGRAYTCIQELEHIADNPTIAGIEGNPPFSNIFLFSARNEEGEEIGSAEELVVMSGEFLSGLLRGDIASDASYALALTKEVEGKRTRYSSFGLAKLIFPVNDVIDAISRRYELRYIENALRDKPPKYNADLLSADVKDFVAGTALDRLSDLMRTNEGGKTLYSEFQYSGSVNEKVNADGFISSLNEESDQFSKTTGVDMSKSLAKRRDGLITAHVERLGSEIDKVMDNPEKGLYYASAFVDVLRDTPSEYVKDDGTSDRYSLTVVEANAKRFFDSTFGIDRPGLSRLKRDLGEKKVLLAKREAELAQRAAEPKQSASDNTTDEAMRGSVEELKEDIKRLEGRRQTSETEVSEFDLKISDPAQRRSMLQNVLDREMEERSKKQIELSTSDSDLHSAIGALEDLYVQRRTLALKLTFLIPAAIAFAIGAVSALRGRIVGLPLGDSLVWGVKALPSVLAIYAVAAAIFYFVKMAPQVKAAELFVEKQKGQKRLAMLALQSAYTQHFKTLFEYELFSGLIGWIADYKIYAGTLSATLSEFLSDLKSKSEELRTSLAGLTFPNSPLLRSAVAKEDVDTIIASNREAAHEEESFRRAKPLAGFFSTFLEERNLSKLHDSISKFVEDVYSSIRRDSIEQVLARTFGSGPRLSARLDQLYQASKAFIQLEVNQGDDVSQPLVYVGTQSDDRSICRELLTRIAGPLATFYATGSQYELTAARMKVGFPAYHVALIRYGRKVALTGDPKRFAVDPSWELDDVIPSLYVAGGADDAARIMVCLGRAFEIIGFDRANGYAFDGALLGITIENAVAELRKASSSKLRNQLSERIDTAKTSPNAMEQLTKSKAGVRGDTVDLEILNRMINELSPLS